MLREGGTRQAECQQRLGRGPPDGPSVDDSGARVSCGSPVRAAAGWRTFISYSAFPAWLVPPTPSTTLHIQRSVEGSMAKMNAMSRWKLGGGWEPIGNSGRGSAKPHGQQLRIAASTAGFVPKYFTPCHLPALKAELSGSRSKTETSCRARFGSPYSTRRHRA